MATLDMGDFKGISEYTVQATTSGLDMLVSQGEWKYINNDVET